MLTVVFPEYFNLAAEVVVGTSDELILAHVPVLLYVLPQHPYTTLVVTLNYLE